MKMPWHKSALGIDVGARTIKGVQIRKSAKRVVMESCFVHDLAEHNAKYPEESRSKEALSALVETNSLGGLGIHSALSDENILRFDLSLPPIPQAEVEPAIRSELEARINFSIDDAVIDFVPNPSMAVSAQQKHYRVFVTQKSVVEDRIKMFEDAKLSMASIDSTMQAIEATLAHNGYLETKTSQVVIDFGESQTAVALVLGAALASVNVYPVASSTIHTALANHLNASYQETERVLRAQERTPEVQRLLAQHFQTLLQEINTSMLYFRELAYSKPVTRILVTGGASLLPELKTALYDQFGTDVEEINPLRAIDVEKPEVAQEIARHHSASFLSVAVGLALRGV